MSSKESKQASKQASKQVGRENDAIGTASYHLLVRFWTSRNDGPVRSELLTDTEEGFPSMQMTSDKQLMVSFPSLLSQSLQIDMREYGSRGRWVGGCPTGETLTLMALRCDAIGRNPGNVPTCIDLVSLLQESSVTVHSHQ